MTADPFFVEGPACISFSGGRTSAYMLRRVLDSCGGQLPEDVHVLFANTGKERNETLDFVRNCEERWNVRVRWIEYHNFVPYGRPWRDAPPRWLRAIDGRGKYETAPFHTYREVTYATASRLGQPFEALIRARRYLPNPVMRMCTQELKVRPMKAFAMGELGFSRWTSIIGLRADEQRRVAKATSPGAERWTSECPLAEAGIGEAEVLSFWRKQSFDLQLRTHEGNCDLCFLKGRQKIERIMRARPDLAEWWIAQETDAIGKPNDMRFRHDRPSYSKMLDDVRRTPALPGFPDDDDSTLPCNCTD